MRSKQLSLLLFFLSFVTSLLFAAAPLDEPTEEFSPLEKQRRLTEIQKSLTYLQKWQGKYQRKQKNFQSRATRLLFKNSTESRQYKGLAQEAKKNVLVLQEQIDVLNSQKAHLMAEN